MIVNRQKLTDFLHVFVLVSFALAQPLYDLLGRYADFFVAHGAGSSALLCLVGVVSVLIPLLFVLIEMVADFLFGEKLRHLVHLCFSGILAALIVMPPLNRWGILPDVVVYLAAVLFGGSFIFLIIKLKITRNFLTILSPVILIFPVYFLFFTPVKTLVLHRNSSPVSDISVRNKVPVILIVFDEFSTMALLNKEGMIDSVRYPNFASLARESWWFPNAISSSLETMKSVPAILTGKKPSVTKRELATYTDHPDNLFRLLAGQYYLNVHETETSLYTDTLKKYSVVFEPASFVSDIRTLYKVLIIPGLFKNSSNAIGGRWKGFTSTVSTGTPGNPSGILFRKKQIENFLTGIRADKRNQLDFLHLSLPHIPYEYLSSGTSYNCIPEIFPDGITREEEGWGNSNDLVEVAYQRYLEQVGFTDKVLGRIIAGIKDKGIYDESLIIVTADHGVSMQPNSTRRDYFEGDRHEVLKIPTLLKLPKQKKGGVCNDLVSGVDILPTIADVLGTKLPWDHDGEPMIPARAGGKQAARSGKADVPEIRVFRLREIEGFPRLGWQTSVFGSGIPLTQLVRHDRNQSLLGKDINGLAVRSNKVPYTFEVENIDQFNDVEPKSGYLPALLRGHVTIRAAKGNLALAIALNGKIWATTSTCQWDDEKAFFTALLPEAAFQQGRNELDVFMIKESRNGGEVSLVRIPFAHGQNIFLRPGRDGGESLVFDDGRKVPVSAQLSEGFLDGFYLGEYTVTISGWAIDKQALEPAKSIVLFADDQYVAQAEPNIERSDIVNYLNTAKVKVSGFQASVPKYMLSGKKLRAFAITRNGVAFELNMTEKARRSMEKFLYVR